MSFNFAAVVRQAAGFTSQLQRSAGNALSCLQTSEASELTSPIEERDYERDHCSYELCSHDGGDGRNIREGFRRLGGSSAGWILGAADFQGGMDCGSAVKGWSSGSAYSGRASGAERGERASQRRGKSRCSPYANRAIAHSDGLVAVAPPDGEPAHERNRRKPRPADAGRGLELFKNGRR